MRNHSTCRSCGGLLHVTDSDTVHPRCDPKPTKAERLANQWLAAVESGDTDAEVQLQQHINDIDQKPPRLMDAALLYISWGWPIFPLRGVGTRCDGDDKCERVGVCQCPKKPATRHGFKDSTTDADRIRAWWERHPTSNIGLPTGIAFDVIDIDVPKGVAALEKIGDKSSHGLAATSSGGLHIYIEPTGRTNGAGIYPGVDYRGKGGYVVAPPSTLGPAHRTWSWINKPSPVLTGQAATYGQ